ncbi:Ankyrin repeat A protein 2 [Coemansia spiralis]|nr:Ankyrin repeat A protein 2 [Coemansia spiralis]
MAGLADLPYELLLELLVRSGNVQLVTVCRWTYFCLGHEATPWTCYRFVRAKGGWRKASVLATALGYRFLSQGLLDQIERNEHELVQRRPAQKHRKRDGQMRMADVKIPNWLLATDAQWDAPVMKKLRSTADRSTRKRRRREENPNQTRFDLVRRLVAMGVSVQGARGTTGLVLAAKAGNMAMVRLLLKNGADATTGGENKALLMAVVYGHLDVAKRLVKAGAPVSSLALRYAVQKHHMDVVDWLVHKGAAPDMATIKLLDCT